MIKKMSFCLFCSLLALCCNRVESSKEKEQLILNFYNVNKKNIETCFGSNINVSEVALKELRYSGLCLVRIKNEEYENLFVPNSRSSVIGIPILFSDRRSYFTNIEDSTSAVWLAPFTVRGSLSRIVKGSESCFLTNLGVCAAYVKGEYIFYADSMRKSKIKIILTLKHGRDSILQIDSLRMLHY